MFDRNKVRPFQDFSGSSSFFTVEHFYEYGNVYVAYAPISHPRRSGARVRGTYRNQLRCRPCTRLRYSPNQQTRVSVLPPSASYRVRPRVRHCLAQLLLHNHPDGGGMMFSPQLQRMRAKGNPFKKVGFGFNIREPSGGFHKQWTTVPSTRSIQ